MTSKCFIFMYFLQPYWVPAMWRSLAQISHAMELLNSGMTYRRVEELTGISKSTLIRARKKQN